MLDSGFWILSATGGSATGGDQENRGSGNLGVWGGLG